MSITKTAEGIYKLSTNIEDILFEGIWEIPNGVNLNSYVVKGEKTAIIDGVCGWDGIPANFLKMIGDMDIKIENLDYIIINHMEPDHSGWIEELRKIKHDIKIVCSQVSKNLLEAFYGYTENIRVVKDTDTLDLGGGRILSFVTIPNVHWPDTIATYDNLTGTLFTCDAFGSFGTVKENKGYDDELTQDEIDFYENEAVRYYSNIVAAFSGAVIKAIGKCSNLDIKIIAPGHGIVWRKNPMKIINDYLRYASYQKGPAKKEITIIWGSMYGMTEKGVRHIESILGNMDIKVNVHNVMEDTWGTILASAWTSTGIILAMPTYEYKMFPPIAAVLEELLKKKILNRIAFRIGSYGWSGGAEKELNEIMERGKVCWEFIESVEFKGVPQQKDLDLITERVNDLLKLVQARLETA